MTDLIIDGELNPALFIDWSLNETFARIKRELPWAREIDIAMYKGGGAVIANYKGQAIKAIWANIRYSGNSSPEDAIDQLKRWYYETEN